MSRRDWDWPLREKPRPVEGGIKAQTKRGAFGQRWWAKRWIAVLEAFELGGRLSRGRAYARAGQVADIALEPGGVRASVQGSRAKPYQVTIRLRELTAREWSAVGAAICANTRLAAMLLAGEMPEDIETAFAAAGTTLFPKRQSEMKTACSCPDWSNPCKHVAAAFYLIGEEFDRDPFLLFLVRGLRREALLELLAPGDVPVKVLQAERDVQSEVNRGISNRGIENRGIAKRASTKRASTESTESTKRVGSRSGKPRGAEAGQKERAGTNRVAGAESAPSVEAPELATPVDFWGAEMPRDLPVVRDLTIATPALEAVLLRKAGRFPFWRADVVIEDALLPIYARAMETALAWLAEHNESSGQRSGVD